MQTNPKGPSKTQAEPLLKTMVLEFDKQDKKYRITHSTKQVESILKTTSADNVYKNVSTKMNLNEDCFCKLCSL